MPRSEKFQDISQRLTLFEKYFEYRTNKEWLAILPYKDEFLVSRVKRGRVGISYEAIGAICGAAGISEKVFRAPLWELAEALEVTDEAGVEKMLASISSETRDLTEELSSEDADLIRVIPGEYLLLYPGREDLNFERKHIIIEKMKILPSTDGRTCEIWQKTNFITGERAVGKLACRARRLSFYLEYAKTYYVESSFLMAPLFTGNGVHIFSGVYLDTAPMDQNQIFSTQFCMFSVEDASHFPRRFDADHDLFSMWADILDNNTQGRGRLIARVGEEFTESVRSASQKTSLNIK